MSKASYQVLLPLLKLKSHLSDVEEFHGKVNVVFHDIESLYYDQIHKEMWESLPQQFARILDSDLLKALEKKQNLTMLDIGCGTGLASDLMLKNKIGQSIDSICLLDTSPLMLQRAKKRAEKWHREATFECGDLDTINQKFDIIITCSVLHHIPDLKHFMEEIEGKLNPNGIFISMHDPLEEAISSKIYEDRTQTYTLFYQKNRKRNLVQRAYAKAIRLLKKFNKKIDYLEEVNQELLSSKVIHTPLNAGEIWSITDIHVEDLPYSNKKGVSIKELEQFAPQLELKKLLTYSFFGTLKSNLLPQYQLKEVELLTKNDPNGRNFGSLWTKR